jgi:DNA-binding transcriptional regulator YiaG
MKKSSFHYTACGLKNIYLLNGFKFHQTPYGKTISIENINGLHSAIAQDIITNHPQLSGDEVRFLRKEMDLSQQRLSVLLGVDTQTVARWEKGVTDIPTSADRIIRLLFREKSKQNPEVLKLIERLNEIEDTAIDRHHCFEETKNGWKVTA